MWWCSIIWSLTTIFFASVDFSRKSSMISLLPIKRVEKLTKKIASFGRVEEHRIRRNVFSWSFLIWAHFFIKIYKEHILHSWAQDKSSGASFLCKSWMQLLLLLPLCIPLKFTIKEPFDQSYRFSCAFFLCISGQPRCFSSFWLLCLFQERFSCLASWPEFDSK